MTTPHLRIIGDVHGKLDKLIEIVAGAEYSLCVGDIGFEYSKLLPYSSEHLKCLAGNHDNYSKRDGKYFVQTPHFLGDFGTWSVPDFGDIFFVRGGYSIDKHRRIFGFNWWHAEELTHIEMNAALDLYMKIKPKFVVTHECPVEIIPYVSTAPEDWGKIEPSNTAKLLQTMFECHQPLVWIHGHHHFRWSDIVNGTQFISLEELGYVDYVDFPMNEACDLQAAYD